MSAYREKKKPCQTPDRAFALLVKFLSLLIVAEFLQDLSILYRHQGLDFLVTLLQRVELVAIRQKCQAFALRYYIHKVAGVFMERPL